MTKRKELKMRFLRAIFGCFLVMMGIFGATANLVSEPAYADPVNSSETTEVESGNEESEAAESTDEEEDSEDGADGCRASMKPIGWIVCPITEKTADAVDWLYDKIEGILTIDPVSMENGSPIYEVWKYCRGLTNIVFIIFLLVVIYSQITGYGISNYGIKKALPKLIISAVMVNLSFLICSLMVDVSNIVGNSLRGFFAAIAEATTFTGDGLDISFGKIFATLTGGGALAVGAGIIAFELGAIWMLIPVLLGALVAVASGLVTIALRQAVVMLLIMISPLAFVAYILPNTDKWFKKWKDLFFKMLVFYPMFSLLFGASSLAGMAIIASAQNMFGVLLGLAVQIFPLFFCWSLMKMSGTFLGDINTRLRGLAATPLAANRAWAGSHRNLARQRNLSSSKAYTPSLKMMQFLNTRRIGREADIDDYSKNAKNRALARRANRNYRDGVATRRGERMYRMQAENMEYERDILRDKNTMNRGLSDTVPESMVAKKARMRMLDARSIDASDYLKVEQARGEKIEYENAVSFHKRMEGAINAHMDYTNGFKSKVDENGRTIMAPNEKYRFHGNVTSREDLEKTAELAKYNSMLKIMDGNAADVQYAGATAAQSYDTQKKIVESKMQKYFDLTPPTKDVDMRLSELTKVNVANNERAVDNIDSIVSGLRILNQRGDTDMVKAQLNNILDKDIGGGVELGTHASQALASFLMFEVKDNDPTLRRFGKYLNLETARVYNDATKRQNKFVTMDEYITGEYEDWEPIDYDHPNAPGRARIGKSKRSVTDLLEGTSFDNVERTAYANIDSMLVGAYTRDGQLDIDKYLKRRGEIQDAMGPAFISASLKYLSGSEQMKNAVSFLTGYNGNKARWDDEEDPLYGMKEKAEPFFRRRAIKYVEDQTPSQILGFRSDYKEAMVPHLFGEYMETDMDGWTDEQVAERAKWMQEWSDLQTRYGDEPTGEAKQKYEAEKKRLINEMAGAQFRQTLESKGTLNQIYRTRRSGAANNAKGWVRSWLKLDDEGFANSKSDKAKRGKKKTQQRQVEDSSVDSNAYDVQVYNDGTRQGFINKVEKIWEDYSSDDATFFEESLEFIKNNLGSDSYIASEYERYRREDPYADADILKSYLEDLLNDADNY